VFLAPSADPSRGRPAYLAYRSDGPRVVDVFALRPLRKAVLDQREDIKELKHGKEGGHGGDDEHAGERHPPAGGKDGHW
jgi:hypothetical protein